MMMWQFNLLLFFAPLVVSRTPMPTVCLGPNQEYRMGNACPLSCDKPKPWGCVYMNVYDCFCEEGYVRLNETTGYYGQGPCIKVEDCPNHEDNLPEASTIPLPSSSEYDYCDGDNEEYTIGSQCPQSCKNPSGVRFCSPQRFEGCFCKNGFVRQNETADGKIDGPCIKFEDCPEQDDFPHTPRCSKTDLKGECPPNDDPYVCAKRGSKKITYRNKCHVCEAMAKKGKLMTIEYNGWCLK